MFSSNSEFLSDFFESLPNPKESLESPVPNEGNQWRILFRNEREKIRITREGATVETVDTEGIEGTESPVKIFKGEKSIEAKPNETKATEIETVRAEFVEPTDNFNPTESLVESNPFGTNSLVAPLVETPVCIFGRLPSLPSSSSVCYVQVGEGNPLISKQHALLTADFVQQLIFLCDTSRHGLWINGKRPERYEKMSLVSGDIIRFTRKKRIETEYRVTCELDRRETEAVADDKFLAKRWNEQKKRVTTEMGEKRRLMSSPNNSVVDDADPIIIAMEDTVETDTLHSHFSTDSTMSLTHPFKRLRTFSVKEPKSVLQTTPLNNGLLPNASLRRLDLTRKCSECREPVHGFQCGRSFPAEPTTEPELDGRKPIHWTCQTPHCTATVSDRLYPLPKTLKQADVTTTSAAKDASVSSVTEQTQLQQSSSSSALIQKLTELATQQTSESWHRCFACGEAHCPSHLKPLETYTMDSFPSTAFGSLYFEQQLLHWALEKKLLPFSTWNGVWQYCLRQWTEGRWLVEWSRPLDWFYHTGQHRMDQAEHTAEHKTLQQHQSVPILPWASSMHSRHLSSSTQYKTRVYRDPQRNQRPKNLPTFSKDSLVCHRCARDLFGALLFPFRRESFNQNQLKGFDQRPDCPLGLHCPNVRQNWEHGIHYNHVTITAKRKE